MELKIELSSATNWISGFIRSFSVEKRSTCEKKGKKPLMGYDTSSSKKGSSRGKPCCGEAEELHERMRVLEEETETMKKAFFWSLEERKVMINEIYKQFQLLHLHGCMQSRNLVLQESSSFNPFEDWKLIKSLHENLSPDQNQTLMTEEFNANALAFQVPGSYRGDIKIHHD